jgi:DNA-binding NarL/FixJ family response regulator
VDQAKLDLLWQHVEDARLKWKSSHNHVKEINQDTDVMRGADGSYAHLHALGAQHLAVKNYLHALQDFKAALALENAPREEQAVETVDGAHILTRREREVLKLIASGKSSKEIAEHLGIAFRTVVCHRYRLQTKLNSHKAADLTRAAMRMGLIEI